MHEFSVSQFLTYLNDSMRALTSDHIAIVGEVAEFKISQDKWVWFKLKDEEFEGVMDCFWTTYGMRQPLEDGMRIRAYGYPKVHPRSGKFSFNITRVELVGEGALKRAYELLKLKLGEEGLFAPERKRALPKFPETIGLITSREAAACTDFQRILKNRWGGVTVMLASVAVQGERAISEIVGAFRYFNSLETKPDVLVLTRGGGSMEDLQAFNSEEVARAVYGSKIPVVCGVGHERDESLADFVADVRASTPSNAAEIVAPDRREIAYQLSVAMRGIEQGMEAELLNARMQLEENVGTMERFFADRAENFNQIRSRVTLALRSFASRIERQRDAIVLAATDLEKSLMLRVVRFSEAAYSHERMVAAMNPAHQLKRGWSLVRDTQGRVVRDAGKLDKGAPITVRLWLGEIGAEVTEIRKDVKKSQEPLL